MKKNSSIIGKVFWRHPDVAFRLARAFLRSKKAEFFDYNFGKGKSNVLPLATIKITPLCNLRCAMCGQRGKTGTMPPEKAAKEVKNIVPIERYMSLTDEMAKFTDIFYIWGGEPFLYPNFMDLAQYMAKKILLSVNTNGTFLEENAERIVKDKWHGIFISLDSFEKINDMIRGEGSYKKVINGIEAINREKKLQKRTQPEMGIVTTVSNMNYDHLDKLAAALKDKGLSWHIINLGTYMDEDIGKEQTKFYREKFGITPIYWKGFANGCNKNIDGSLFEKILTRVHSYKNGYPVITVPVIRPSRIGEYYGDLKKIVRDHCLAPWFSVNIDYNGDVHFCADYPDWVIGNIKQQTMWEIYNSDRAIKFRNELRNAPNGIFPACRRCYQLMLCGKRKKGY